MQFCNISQAEGPYSGVDNFQQATVQPERLNTVELIALLRYEPLWCAGWMLCTSIG